MFMGSTSGSARHRPLSSIFLDALSQFFGFSNAKNEHGKVTLGHGVQEVQIATSSTPKAVWITFGTGSGHWGDHQDKPHDKDHGWHWVGTPVCIGGIDMAGIQILDKGFVIHADVKSVSATLRWFAHV